MRKLVFGIVLLAVVGVGAAALLTRGENGGPEIKTASVVRGALRTVVETTGSVSPLISVNVGCEVSGTVGELFADFNSVVQKGQVLAKLRPELFEADLAQAKANVLAAEAQRQGAEVEVKRWQRQVGRLAEMQRRSGAAAVEEVRTAEENFAAAQAKLAAAEASIKQSEAVRDLAQTKLDRSVIFAPMDGIILSRHVDVGSTVVSAFTTPLLFVIAPNLDRMQVHANVSESDIGRVRAGQTAEFTVDAFPDHRISGQVTQVRNNPSTIQNVVTYTVVVEVDNRSRLLKPGMTANVTIEVARRDEAVKIANSALRFRPPLSSEEVAEKTAALKWPEVAEAPPAASTNPTASAPAADGSTSPTIRQQSVLWTMANGAWQPIPVVIGITDNRETEIIAGAEAGTNFVISARPRRSGFSLKEALNMASPENRSL